MVERTSVSTMLKIILNSTDGAGGGAEYKLERNT